RRHLSLPDWGISSAAHPTVGLRAGQSARGSGPKAHLIARVPLQRIKRGAVASSIQLLQHWEELVGIIAAATEVTLYERRAYTFCGKMRRKRPRHVSEPTSRADSLAGSRTVRRPDCRPGRLLLRPAQVF